MNTLQDVREAQQMWERNFKNADREGIVLSDGKPGSFINTLKSIYHKIVAMVTIDKSNLKDDYQPV